MSIIKTLNLADIKYACRIIRLNPGVYGSDARKHAEATKTPGRYKQRRLAAGREAIRECLFKLVPELKGDYHHLTAALRAGAIAEGKSDADWGHFNELGAQALGLPEQAS